MPQSRSSQVDVSVTPYYHCISRCVRRAFLCGDDKYSGRNFDHRKRWLVQRLELLAEAFAIDVCAFAVMSNHLHLVVRIDPARGASWTDEEVAERYGRLFRLAKVRWGQLDAHGQAKQAALWRERLCDLSWMMRSLNEWIARQANREDGCKGRFWEGRFKSQPLLDEEALLTCMAYVDLNPVRAGLASSLEEADFTSIQARLRQAASKGSPTTRRADAGHTSSSEAPNPNRNAGRPWHPISIGTLMPFADQTRSLEQTGIPMHFADYVELVAWTGRAVRSQARGAELADVPSSMERVGCNAQAWVETMAGHGLGDLTALGRTEALQALAERRHKRWVKGQRWARAMTARLA